MKQLLALAAGTLSALPVAAAAGPPSDSFAFPGLGTVSLYAPTEVPRQVVLFVSGDGGWNLGVVPMAERLRDQGALVAGIDIRALMRTLEGGSACAYPAGILEELSRNVQLRRHLPAYRRPILVGYSSGATLVYAAIAAAPAETFAGAISLGFCPDIEIVRAPCAARGLRATRKKKGLGYDLAPDATLPVPWHVLQGEVDEVCSPTGTRAFVAQTGRAVLHSLPKVGHGFSITRNWEPEYLAAYRELAREEGAASDGGSAPRAARVADLGLEEVPAAGPDGDLFAVILSGDGGWAEIDKGIAASLAARGLPSVGWSSLRYYWTPRTPEAAAADLARVLDHYSTAWAKRRVLLVGYSFGADVLPFLVNRLPSAARERVAGVALLGLSDTASFEFHLTSWLGGGGDRRYRTVPEVARLSVPVLCLHGSDESDSACRALRGPGIRVSTLGHGHHLGGDWERLAEAILADLKRP